LENIRKQGGYVSSVVFYTVDLCDLLPFVHNKNNRRRYSCDEQEPVKAPAILGEGECTF
jgi:hypothetical protein